MDEDRRKSGRLKLVTPAAAKVRTYVSGQVLDVSETGLLMRVRKLLSSGTAYTLRVTLPEGELEVSGKVRRSWLAGFETDEEGDRVRVYNSAIELDNPIPGLAERFRPGEPFQMHAEEE